MTGLEFLREYGGRRVRSYPDQPELINPEEPEEDADSSSVEPVDHDYEQHRDAWRPIRVDGAVVDWEEAPRRFVDGCHVGHTIAWLQDAEGHPVPLMLAEIGGVCLIRDGRELRRAFQVVERVVALVADPFPWDRVEAFAIALAESGFRLLPASAPRLEGRGDWAATYDFEVMRGRARNRSMYEMALLEELAVCQDTNVPTLVDGPMEQRINSDDRLQLCPIVGVIKQHRKRYLHPKGWTVYYGLEPGRRTPAFRITGNRVPVVSWYVKLEGAHGSLPSWGIVRVEIAERYFERIGRDFGLIDRLSHALIQMRCRVASYRRGPVSLTPIVRAEQSLHALFSPPSWLAQNFYRLTGI